MKKVLKSLLLTLLVAAMMLNTCGIVLAGTTTTFSVTEAVVDEATGVRKLVFSIAPASAISFFEAGVVFSYDNTVIQPVKVTDYSNETVVAGPVDMGNVSLSSVKATTGSMAGLEWYIKDSRTGVRMALMAFPAATVTSETALFEFYYKVKAGKSANSETFMLETDYSEGSILKALCPTESTAATVELGDVKYGTPSTTDAEAIGAVTVEYEGSNILVLGSIVLAIEGDDEVIVPTVYDADGATGNEAVEVNLVATATSTTDEDMAVPAGAVWSMECETPDDKVSISGEGANATLTVEPGALSNSVTVTVTADGKSDSSTITLVREAEPAPTAMVVKADGVTVGESITIVKPATEVASPKKVALTDVVYDQYGVEIAADVAYEVVAGTTADAWITEDDEIAVPYGANDGDFEVVATYEEVEKTFTVSIVGLEVNWGAEVVVSEEITYGETNESAVALPADKKGTASVDGDVVNGVYAVVDAEDVQDAGEATIEVTFTANDDEGDYAGVEITKAYPIIINKAPTEITASDKTVEYDGTPKAIEATITEGADNELEYRYRRVEAVELYGTPAAGGGAIGGGATASTATAPTDAGIYKVTISADATNNWEAPEDKVVYLTITTTATVSLDDIIVAKSALDTAEDYSDIRLPESVEVTFGDDTSDEIEILGWTKTLAELKALDVEDSVVISITGESFPTWVTSIEGNELTFEVTDKYPVNVEVTMYGGTYGDALEGAYAEQIAIADGIDEVAEFTYTYTGVTDNGEDYESEEVPTEAGSYKVTAVLVSETHAGSASVDFVIAPLAIDVTISDATKVYGDENPDFEIDADVSAEVLEVEFETEATADSDAGEYTITAVAGNKNYDVNWTEGTLTIEPKDLADTDFVAVITGSTENGATLTVEVEGLDDDQYVITWNGETQSAAYVLDWADSNTTISASIEGINNYTGTLEAEDVDIDRYEIGGILGYTMINGEASDEAKLDLGDTITLDLEEVIGAFVFDELGETPVYTWYLDGEVIADAVEESLTITEGMVGVLSATLAAEGNFAGIVEVIVGEIGKIVLDGEITFEEVDDEIVATIVIEGAVEGEDYEVKWFRGETELTAVDGVYAITSDDYGTTITVKVIAIGDNYTGEMVAAYDIAAIEPSDVEITAEATKDSITVVLTAVANGSEVTEFTVTLTDAEDVEIETATVEADEDGVFTYTFEDLESGTDYVVTAIATNGVGDSDEATLDVKTKSSVVSSSGMRPSTITKPEEKPEEKPETPDTDVTVKVEDTKAEVDVEALEGKENVAVTTETESGTAITTTVAIADTAVANLAVSTTDSDAAAIGAAAEGAIGTPVEVKVEATDAEGNAVEVEVVVAIPSEEAAYAYVIDENGVATRTESVYNEETGAVEVAVSGDAVVMISTTAPATFDDTDAHWAAGTIDYIVDAGLMNGVGGGAFDPDGKATRGMINAMLVRLAKATGAEIAEATDAHKVDTTGSHWAAETDLIALANGWTTGVRTLEDGTVVMDTDATVTREQLVTMLWRYVGQPEAEGTIDSFADHADTSDWAKDAKAWAVGAGIINGKPGNVLDPNGTATRAEIATMYQRLMNYMTK